MPKLSVTIITRNEAANLPAALESVSWADEVLVVDCGSTDGTTDIARGPNVRVMHREWRGYAEQKNFAADNASHEWILSLDADERVTPELAAEIRGAIGSEPAHAGYRVPRISWYMGRWIRTTDWYPDLQLRLYNRTRGRWSPRRVHESVTVKGQVGTLRQPLEHRPYRDLSHHLETMNRYTTLAAEDLYERGRRSGVGPLLVLPPAAFLRNYVLRRGFLQGTTGLTISLLNTFYVLLKFLKLLELQRRD